MMRERWRSFVQTTGWVFFDMYDELKRDVLRRLGRVVREAVGNDDGIGRGSIRG